MEEETTWRCPECGRLLRNWPVFLHRCAGQVDGTQCTHAINDDQGSECVQNRQGKHFHVLVYGRARLEKYQHRTQANRERRYIAAKEGYDLALLKVSQCFDPCPSPDK